MVVNIAWRRSAKDHQVHAFPLEVAEPGWMRLEALCSHSARAAAVEPPGHRGHWQALLDPDTCLTCLVVISDLLFAEAGRYGAGARDRRERRLRTVNGSDSQRSVSALAVHGARETKTTNSDSRGRTSSSPSLRKP